MNAIMGCSNDKGHGMMRRFKLRNRNAENILQLLYVCASLYLLSHSSSFLFILQTTFSPLYLSLLLPLFHNTFFVFLLVNAIILLIYAFSNNNVVRDQTTSSLPVLEETVFAVPEKKSYRRVLSENFERRIVAPSPPPRRSKTISLERTKSQRQLCCVEVEQLSEHEFNRAVEDFIAKHKKMLWEEQTRSSRNEPSC
ncbi:hypothetical protein RJT34_08716 [Clitoria ternatea]|uniref:DUF4408 domain-containing protein n=1 Tax=Clitoria ternatea TaxID=43366 RepID=A0AAN9K6Y9_CLITE